MTKCNIKNCTDLVYQCGVCGTHYHHLRKYGEIRRSRRELNEFFDMGEYFAVNVYSSNLLPINQFFISKEDIDKIKTKHWCLQKSSVKGKFYIKESKPLKAKYLHRILLKPKKGMEVDHINGNTLDNRRENLRICDKVTNGQNKVVRGTNFHKQMKKWRAYTTVRGGKQINFGFFDTEQEARDAYLKNIVNYRGILRY